MNANANYDVIVWGATGFTGRLVAAYLLQQYGVDGDVKWAVAARSQQRLDELISELGARAKGLQTFTADSHDLQSLRDLTAHTRVLLTTVGPYMLYGSNLVQACIETDTDYCDLSGEVPWMRQMLDKYGAAAAASQARIVHCCGFDSIPSDLGVLFMQHHAQQRFGQPLQRLKMRVRAARGGLSGGTYASMLNIGAQARQDPAVANILKNPYSLCPPQRRKGVRQPYVAGAEFDADFGAWAAPFVMAAINTRIVHRSNALADAQHYLPELVYDEAVLTGTGFSGRTKALSVSLGMGAFLVGSALAPTRALLKRFVLPKPGEGPSKTQREQGFFKLQFHGVTSNGDVLRGSVSGDRDPGYGSTSKMISTAAVALSQLPKDALPGGFWTPATALGLPLIERLQANAGLVFKLLD
ncbi:MAG: saccharopine dehydrogenase NADP-binding domain-containing protein [Gammaproteobacteria bacterium]|jgi:short subunit dehydrogenase-like uncharacterized protein|nr:saccharopine dehydrogenase NADP-binding domain-containing protein [Gammaproteobacteria bacterium]